MRVLPRFSAACLVAFAVASSRLALADAPLRTDNADVPDQGNCKVEVGYEGTPHTRNYVVAPSCVPWGVIELGAAYARSRDAERTWSNGVGLQAKAPLVPRDDDDDKFAIAATLSVARDSATPGQGFQFASLNVPVSFYEFGDRWRIHVNAGAAWQRDEAIVFTWGIATEYDIGRFTPLAEIYRQESGRPRYNVGLRYSWSEGFDLYVSAGRRFGSDPEGWLVIAGIKLESPTFLK